MNPDRFVKGCAGVVANVSKPHATEAARAVLLALNRCGMRWRLEAATAAVLQTPDGLGLEQLVREVTWLIVIGGDGTILQTARATIGHDLPILGINPGQSLGLMTDTPVADLIGTLEDVRQGHCTVIERAMLRAELCDGDTTTPILPALNDIVFLQDGHARLVMLKVEVNDELLTTYAADGLIVATATGSTAHSMSAGGPILFPTIDAMVLTPICPHTLTNRPIILPRGAHLDISLGEPRRAVQVAVDGQRTHALTAAEHVAVQLDQRTTRFINSKRHSFCEMLREKLHWRGDLKVDRATE